MLTEMMEACGMEFHEAFGPLLALKNGANVNHVDKHGSSPLNYTLCGEGGSLRRYGITATSEEFQAVTKLFRCHGARRISGLQARRGSGQKSVLKELGRKP